MEKHKWLVPVIGVIGVVVAIWAAMRKTGTSPTVVLQTSPSLQPNYGASPGITPLGAPPVDVYVSPMGAQATNAAVPGTSSSGVPNYTAQTQLQGGSNPQLAPVPVNNIPSFYGPIRNFIDSMMPQTDTTPTPKKDSCGCGGGGGCGCSTSCTTNNSQFTDGRGGCLAFNRQKQIQQALDTNPTMFFRASENIKSANVDVFDVFQQTVYDMASRHGDVPASPFLSPV